jgi:TetR/AcrR family transcriptional repressor of mexJK operon
MSKTRAAQAAKKRAFAGMQPALPVQLPRPRGRPRAEDLNALEVRLLSTARKAFVMNGYGAASMNAIAKFASVSKNTLYARFPSKAALFRAIVEREIAGAQAEMAPAISVTAQPLYKRLRHYLNVALRRSVDREVLEITRLIISESPQFPELAEAASARFQLGVRHLAQLIEANAQQDGVRCRNPAAAAEMLLSQAYGWYMFVMITNRDVTDRERTSWVASAVDIFMAGRSAW